MAQFDDFIIGGKYNAMFANHAAAAQYRKTDIACLACTGYTVAPARGDIGQFTPRPSAAAAPSSNAVPDGASTLCR